MITAVDSSVLIDVLGPDPTHGERSRVALRAAYDAGSLVACDVVWAEMRVHFADDAAFDTTVGDLGVEFSAISSDAARLAGALWRRQLHGSVSVRKSRVVADFLIGAHAMAVADALLTRDRGFYRKWFSGLRINDPSAR
ncbi:MAG: PIN domain-containing protein [Deltaproteobacteria bacterium]|nr:PIN domain-containing protein [Deltaproteobacteria bacterium]